MQHEHCGFYTIPRALCGPRRASEKFLGKHRWWAAHLIGSVLLSLVLSPSYAIGWISELSRKVSRKILTTSHSFQMSVLEVCACDCGSSLRLHDPLPVQSFLHLPSRCLLTFLVALPDPPLQDAFSSQPCSERMCSVMSLQARPLGFKLTHLPLTRTGLLPLGSPLTSLSLISSPQRGGKATLSSRSLACRLGTPA